MDINAFFSNNTHLTGCKVHHTRKAGFAPGSFAVEVRLNESNLMKYFLSQKLLEEWTVDDKADALGTQLFIRASKTNHPIVPAVHFTRTISGNDGHKLLGRVKTLPQLEAIGAEHLADSCIVAETAYHVTEGYITDAQGPALTASVSAAPTVPELSPEAELLAAFISSKN